MVILVVSGYREVQSDLGEDCCYCFTVIIMIISIIVYE
jgi:hypothetical protein